MHLRRKPKTSYISSLAKTHNKGEKAVQWVQNCNILIISQSMYDIVNTGKLYANLINIP